MVHQTSGVRGGLAAVLSAAAILTMRPALSDAAQGPFTSNYSYVLVPKGGVNLVLRNTPGEASVQTLFDFEPHATVNSLIEVNWQTNVVNPSPVTQNYPKTDVN